MKSKIVQYLLPLAAVLLLVSCTNGKSEEKPENGEMESPAQTSVTKTMECDSMKITWIKDNPGDKLMPRSLFPEAPDSLIAALGLQNGIPSTVSVFLLETDSLKILFDTGLGGNIGTMQTGLDSLGIAPSDITHIYLTHFHGDHIGGMMDGDNAVFANAEVYASKAEYEAWSAMDSTENTMQMRTMQAYENRLHLFRFGDTLPGKVKTIDTSGHTPGHTAYLCGKVIVIADLMHGAALQARYPEYSSNYDMDKDKAAQSRKRILQYAADNGLTMAGMHLPAPAFMK